MFAFIKKFLGDTSSYIDGDDSSGGFTGHSVDHATEVSLINPSTGLPMVDGPGSVDVGGNLYLSEPFHLATNEDTWAAHEPISSCDPWSSHDTWTDHSVSTDSFCSADSFSSNDSFGTGFSDF